MPCLVWSYMATTNMGVLTSSVNVQGWTKELFSTAKTATKEDSHVLSSWKLLWYECSMGVVYGIKEAEELRQKWKVAWWTSKGSLWKNLFTYEYIALWLLIQKCDQKLFFTACAWLDYKIWGHIHPTPAFSGVIEQQALLLFALRQTSIFLLTHISQ